MRDVDYYACYSSDYRFAEEAPDSMGPDRGVYRLRLPGGASATYRYTGKPGKDEEVEERHLKMDLWLHLLCRGGTVVAAAASPDSERKRANRVFSLPVDASGLRIEDGRVRGEVAVTLLSQGRYLLPQKSGEEVRRFTIDAPLGQAAAEGTFTVGEDERTLTVLGSGEPVLAADRSLVVYHSSGTGGNRGPRGAGEHVSLDARFVDGALERWYLCTFAKGGPSQSTVARCDLRWDGHRFDGTIVLENPEPGHHDPAATIRIEGVLIGDQLFGSTTSDIAGPETDTPGRLRGLILRPEAPPIIGWDEGMAKRWMKAHPDADEPMPDIMLEQK